MYLHRTVADFVHKPEVWDELVSHTEDSKFHASLAVLQSLVMEAKMISLGRQPLADLNVPWDLMINAQLFARLAESQTRTSTRQLLDELDGAMTTYFPDVMRRLEVDAYEGATWCATYDEDYHRPVPWHDNFCDGLWGKNIPGATWW
jgi:hypothetical protein